MHWRSLILEVQAKLCPLTGDFSLFWEDLCISKLVNQIFWNMSLKSRFPLNRCTLNRASAVQPWMIRHRMLGKAQISLLPEVILKILKIWIQLWSLTRAGLPWRIDVMVLVVGCFLGPRGWGRWGDQGLHPGRVEAGRGNGLGATEWGLYQVGGHHFATTHSPSQGSDSRGRSARCRPRTRASTW